MSKDEYSDEQLDYIIETTELWVEECSKSSEFKKFPEERKENFDFIVSCFAEMMYNYHLLTPRSWTATALEDVLTNLFPDKILMDDSVFEDVKPSLLLFFDFLEQQKNFTAKKAQTLKNRVTKVTPTMLWRAKDAQEFSPMKQLLLQAQEQGIDLDDIDALNAMLKRNREENAPPLNLFGEPTDFSSPKKNNLEPNEPCPCGSGDPYNKCCGSKATTPSKKSITKEKKIKKAKEPSMEQWNTLYDLGEEIKKAAPWEDLWDSDIIVLQLPHRAEPVYISVLGHGDECYAINIYPGYDSFHQFLRLATAPIDEPVYISMFQQNCLICNFGDRDELETKDRELIKTLGRKYRGRNQWIYFRTFAPGHFPWFISEEQADILITSLEALLVALEQIKKEPIPHDFKNNNSQLQYYSTQAKQWDSETSPLATTWIVSSFIITDELLVARLGKQKRNSMNLEFDVFYLPTPIQEHKDDVPRLPLMALLVDRESGMALDQHMAEPDESSEYIAVDMIRKHIMNYGRPKSISVRSVEIGCLLRDLCQKIDVTLVQDDPLYMMNELMENLLDFMG